MRRKTSLIRLALALAVVSVTACNDDNGSEQSDVGLGANTPVLWIPSSPGTTFGGGTTGDTPLPWIDPNNAVGGTGGIFVNSVDEVYYDVPVRYIDVHHQIMTHTADNIIVQPELYVMAYINGYRQSLNGGIVDPLQGGAGGQIPQLRMNTKLIKNARALCKHYVFNHAALAFTVPDPEGQTFATGASSAPGAPAALPGRNGKSGVNATGGLVESLIAGPTWTNTTNVAREYITLNQAAIANPTTLYIGVGHWRGGSQQWYWTLLMAGNVP